MVAVKPIDRVQSLGRARKSPHVKVSKSSGRPAPPQRSTATITPAATFEEDEAAGCSYGLKEKDIAIGEVSVEDEPDVSKFVEKVNRFYQFLQQKPASERDNMKSIQEDDSVDERQTEIFTCLYCPYETIVEESWKKHLNHHVNEYKLRCDYCSYGTDISAYLAQHVALHFQPNSHQFTTAPSYITPVLPSRCDPVLAPDEDPACICRYCGRMFTTAADCSEHILYHVSFRRSRYGLRTDLFGSGEEEEDGKGNEPVTHDPLVQVEAETSPGADGAIAVTPVSRSEIGIQTSTFASNADQLVMEGGDELCPKADGAPPGAKDDARSDIARKEIREVALQCSLPYESPHEDVAILEEDDISHEHIAIMRRSLTPTEDYNNSTGTPISVASPTIISGSVFDSFSASTTTTPRPSSAPALINTKKLFDILAAVDVKRKGQATAPEAAVSSSKLLPSRARKRSYAQFMETPSGSPGIPRMEGVPSKVTPPQQICVSKDSGTNQGYTVNSGEASGEKITGSANPCEESDPKELPSPTNAFSSIARLASHKSIRPVTSLTGVEPGENNAIGGVASSSGTPSERNTESRSSTTNKGDKGGMKELMVKEAQDLFADANLITHNLKSLILRFMAGKREHPCPEKGPVLSIKLNEGKDNIECADGSKWLWVREGFVQLDYSTGEWRKIIKTKRVPSDSS